MFQENLIQTTQDSLYGFKNDTSNIQSGEANHYEGLKSSWPQLSPQEHLRPKGSVHNKREKTHPRCYSHTRML